MQWQIWLYLLACFLVMAIPVFVASLILARFFKLSQAGGFLISFSVVFLIITIACIIDLSFAFMETIFFTAIISFASISIGSKIGLRWRIRRVGEEANNKSSCGKFG